MIQCKHYNKVEEKQQKMYKIYLFRESSVRTL